MPSSATRKTKSAHKYGLIFIALVVSIALGFAVLSTVKRDQAILELNGQQSRLVDVFETPQERQKGLSGRDSLPADAAVLFVFEEPGLHCFWMKDMSFNIDIVWLDSDKNVVFAKENLSPATYPERFCTDKLAQYVIEMNAGTSQAQLGDTASFEL